MARRNGATDGGTGAGALRPLLPLGVVLALLGIWEATVVLAGIEPFVLPPPSAVAARLVEDAPYLARHGLITFIEIIAGLLTGAGVGILSALLMAAFHPAERLLWPAIVATQALPVFAIAPLLVQWFGFGLASKIVMASLIIFFPVASAAHDGLKRTDPGLVDLARLWGASRLDMLRLVRLPAALPAVASGLRIAAAIAPIGAVVGEWVGASAGLGFIMLHANARLQTDLVFAALIILAAVAVAVRALVGWATRRMVPWVNEQPA